MYYFKFFMPEGDGDAGGNMGGTAGGGDAGAGDAPAPTVGDLDNPEGEGTTPEEVAKILNIPAGKVSAPAAAAGDDEEENPDGEGGDGDGEHETEENAAAAAAAGNGEGGEGGGSTTPPANPPAKPADPDAPAAGAAGAAETPDFSITVEDKEGRTFKITAGDNIDDVLDEFEPKNTAQVMQIMREVQRIEDEKADWDAEQSQIAEQAARDERIQAIQEGWKGEITELQAAGRLPKVADGTKNDRVDAVYAFMGEENARRAAAGKPQIASFEDALDKMELNERRAAEEQAKKDAKDAARKNGGKVGGSSAPASNAPPAYKTGPNRPRNANQALKGMGVL